MPDFAQQLLEAASFRTPRQSAFFRNIQQGAYPRQALSPYATGIYCLARSMPGHLGRIHGACPDPGLRLHVLANLLEEEGVRSFADGKLRADPGARHDELARRFAHALDIGDDALAAADGPAGAAFNDLLDGGDWLAACAYLMVGVEANGPPSFATLVPALRGRYGFSDDEIAFFIEHTEADTRHSEVGARLVAEAARTAQDRQRALAAARRGAAAWWGFHAGCHRQIQALVAPA